MKPTVALTVALLLGGVAGCGREAPVSVEQAGGTATVPADAVARWSGGQVSLAQVEDRLATSQTDACLKVRSQAGGGSLDELLPCYEEVARALALEALILAENPDLEAQALSSATEESAALRRAAFERVFLRQLAEGIEVDEADIEADYEANAAIYHQPGSVVLFDIFRRHADADEPEKTDAFLRELAARFEAGETWEDLALQHSHSENRLRGGAVGLVVEGRLPRRLEEVAFGLEPGGVSEPVRVRGGSVLLHVRDVTEGADRGLDEVRPLITAKLMQAEIQAAIDEYLAEAAAPEGSTVLPTDELLAALDGPDPEAKVLEIGERGLTVAQLRAAVGLEPMARAAQLDEQGRQNVEEVYRRHEHSLLLPYVLVERGDPELTAAVDEEMHEQAVRAMVDEKVKEELTERARGETERLRAYWQDNQQHFQTPLRYQIRLWRVPFGDDPPGQVAEMEKMRVRLEAGELDLSTAAAQLGGAIEARGWVEQSVLALQLPPKGVAYLAQVGGEGYSVPYQQADALHMIHVVAREEPKPRSYEEARDDVVEAYVTRFAQELYRQMASERLSAAGFTFDEDAVRRLLAPPL